MLRNDTQSIKLNTLLYKIIKLNSVKAIHKYLTKKKIRSELHKYGFIRKIRLKTDNENCWYLNPYLVNKSNQLNGELEKIFRFNEYKKINSGKYEDEIMNILF